MGFNILQIMQKYSQFMSWLQQSKQDPASLLDAELKKRNISANELRDLISQAKNLEKLIGGKKNG